MWTVEALHASLSTATSNTCGAVCSSWKGDTSSPPRQKTESVSEAPALSHTDLSPVGQNRDTASANKELSEAQFATPFPGSRIYLKILNCTQATVVCSAAVVFVPLVVSAAVLTLVASATVHFLMSGYSNFNAEVDAHPLVALPGSTHYSLHLMRRSIINGVMPGGWRSRMQQLRTHLLSGILWGSSRSSNGDFLAVSADSIMKSLPSLGHCVTRSSKHMIIDSQPAELFVDPDTSPLVANGTVSAFLPKDEQFLVSILKELPGVDVHSLPIQAAIQRMGNLLKEPF